MKNKNAQTIENEFSKNLTKSKRSPVKIESGRGAEVYNSTFQNFLRVKNIHHNSRFTDKGPNMAEKVIRTVRNLLGKQYLKKGDADCFSKLPTVLKKYEITIHDSTKMKPIDSLKKINEKEVYSNLQNKREKNHQNIN